MKTIWLALAAVSAAALSATAAQATLFNFDIQYWSGVGSPPAHPAEEDFAHFVVDDAFGGTISNHGHPTGIWTYGNAGSYFGLPFQDAFIDIYNDYWGGGFTFIPYIVDADGNEPDYDWELDFEGPSVLGGSAGNYVIQAGVYDYDYYGDGAFRVTITESGQGAVPEPASWALMLGGFGLIGGAMRQRRGATVRFG